MAVTPLTEHHLEFLSLKVGAVQARLSLLLSKCHSVEKSHVAAHFHIIVLFVY